MEHEVVLELAEHLVALGANTHVLLLVLVLQELGERTVLAIDLATDAAVVLAEEEVKVLVAVGAMGRTVVRDPLFLRLQILEWVCPHSPTATCVVVILVYQVL